jgi:hypothetical protein
VIELTRVTAHPPRAVVRSETHDLKTKSGHAKLLARPRRDIARTALRLNGTHASVACQGGTLATGNETALARVNTERAAHDLEDLVSRVTGIGRSDDGSAHT